MKRGGSMNDSYIVTVYVVIDDILKAFGYEDDCRAQGSAAEILTVAVVAAKYLQNHHERTLYILCQLGYIGHLSVSRFNRRLHALYEWLHNIALLVGELFAQGEVFIIDSMPLPVCQRVRARRCKKVCGRAFCGFCAAKQEKFFGWRLHLICTEEGIPVSFDLLPAAHHDLTALHELAFCLPAGAALFGDKGFIAAADAKTLLAETGVRLVTPKRKNMAPNTWADDYDLAHFRKRIESVYSQLEAMGVQRLHARTNLGFELKAFASILALAFSNIISV
jgi:hypothetical protein